jgi:N-acetylneuraminate synthase/N,N'-diacetyllegionaminate synthase
MKIESIDLLGRPVGPRHPCFVIAEAGINHNGDPEMALKLVDAAARVGAEAVKFQTFRAEQVVSAYAPKAEYQVETTGENETQLEMAKKLELSYADFERIKAHCDVRGITFLSTPFDEESADFLENLGVPAFKIPSGEIVNPAFLEHVARKGKPLLVSTGMSSLGEVDEAVRIIRQTGNKQFVLLHCVSSYPAEASSANLRAMTTMREAFQVPVGYSDHTQGIEVPLAAVALGACVIEKHFTLDRDLRGPDHRASADENEFAVLLKAIRRVEESLGHGRKEPALCEAEIARVARRSLVAARAISSGTILTRDLIAVKRPGTGIAPRLLSAVLGRKAAVNIDKETVITWEMLV